MSMMQSSAAFRTILKSRPVMGVTAGSGIDNIFSDRFDPQAEDADRGIVTREELIALFSDLLVGAKPALSPVATSGTARDLLAGKARARRVLALAAAARRTTPRPAARVMC